MKLSIAMCTYNGGRFLREQLDSIASQHLLPDELVICDDGSTDATKKIIEDFASNSPFTVRLYINEERLGPSQNFVKAISLCEGDIIALADQDDVWLPAKLRRIMMEFASNPAVGMVFSDAEVVDIELRPCGYRAWASTWVEFGPKEQRLFRDGKALDVLLIRNIVTGATLAFRSTFKELILPIPDMNERVLHDYWIALVIAAVSNLRWIDEPFVKYRHHQGQYVGLLPPGRRDACLTEPGDFGSVNPLRDDLLEALLERFVLKNRAPEYDEVISRLEHLQIRANMRTKDFGVRVRRALREVWLGRYHLYSRGFRSAAEDISWPHKLLRIKTFIQTFRRFVPSAIERWVK